jgi:DNA-directed RNA polymerase II subunit RPB1
MDARWIEDNHFPSFPLDASNFKKKYAWDLDSRELSNFMNPDVIDDIRRNVEVSQALQQELDALESDREIAKGAFATSNAEWKKAFLPMPLSIERMLINAKQRFRVRADGISDMHPVRDVINPVNALFKRLLIVPGKEPLAEEAQKNATALLFAQLRCMLASKRMIVDHRMTKEAFQWLLGVAETRFNISLAPAGDMVGVVAAQSLGEPLTQMTLNTFHHAGVSAKNVTLGVPRLKELINVAKHLRTPSVTIFVKSHLTDASQATQLLQQQLEYTLLSDLVEDTQVIYDPDPVDSVVPEDDWVKYQAFMYDEGTLQKLSPWVLRLKLSKEQMIKRVFRLKEIKEKILEFDNTLDVVDNGEGALVPIIRIRISSETRKDLASVDEDEETRRAREAVRVGDEDERTLRDFEHALLYEQPLRGIFGIKKLYKSDHNRNAWNRDKGFHQAKETRFETDGTNLSKVLILPDVDHRRTVSNDIVETLTVLGIEACRKLLLTELRNVLAFDGSYVNYRHLALLVDTMTFRGHLLPVTRHGINRQDSGPLIRSSFEETCEILMDAAIFGEADDMRGASDNIMLGQMCPLGTGHFDLLLDESRLQEVIPVDMSGELKSNFNDAKAAQTPMFVGTPDMLNTMGSQSVYSGMTPGAAQFSPVQHSPDAYGLNAGGFTPAAGYIPESGSFTPAIYERSYSPFTTATYDRIQSPAFTPTDSYYGGVSPASVGMSPASPGYSPTSVISGGRGNGQQQYSPTSPALQSPTSPRFATVGDQSPSLPTYSPDDATSGEGNQEYSPLSAAFTPAADSARSPISPAYGAGMHYTPYSPTAKRD